VGSRGEMANSGGEMANSGGEMANSRGLAGTAALHELDAKVHAAQDALLEPLTAAERAQLNALLQRLLEHHSGHHPE
jgi:hypothetical protein